MNTFLKIENGVVINAAIFDKDAPEGWIKPANPAAGIGWTHSAGDVFAAPVIESKELTTKDYINAAQQELDKKAQLFGYDNILTSVTYADEPRVPRFQSEGRALRKWRSLVWAYAYDMLEQVEQGIISPPTIEDFVAGMPAYE